MAALLWVPSASAEDGVGPPSPPRDFAANVNEALTEILLSWSVPLFEGSSDIVQYNVYKDGDFVTSVSGLSYQDSVVESTAMYVVTAVNIHGEGLPSRPSGPLIQGGCIILSPQHVPPWAAADLGCTFVFFNLICGIPQNPPHTQLCLVRTIWVDVVQNATGRIFNVPVLIDLHSTFVGPLYESTYATSHSLRPL
jgi:hypothetical protein